MTKITLHDSQGYSIAGAKDIGDIQTGSR